MKRKQTIMVIDDDKSNLTAAKILLEGQYEVSLVNSGIKALKLLERYIPDLILLDLKMPEMDGFEVIDVMKNKENLKNIPVIILTADKSDETERDCFVHGAVDFIGKPFKAAVMLERVRRTLELESLRNDLEQQVEEKAKEVEAVVLQSITAVANTIDARSEYTRGHSVRVAELSVWIAEKMGWQEKELSVLYQAALLHDIGNIGISDSILNQSGVLSENERESIRSHTTIGADILKDIKDMKEIMEGVLHHHERYDGDGYPSGLAGEEIPVSARIIAVADAYEAMSSDRVYRKRLTDKKIRFELRREKGRQFDPKIVDVLLELLEEHGNIWDLFAARKMNNSGRLLELVLEKQSETDRNEAALDWLTGLYNRSYLEKEIMRRVNREEGAFLLIDLDNFKMINDFNGHAAGDSVLRMIAEILKSHAGEQDLASRVGGDEFVIYYSECSAREQVEKKVKELFEQYNEKKKTDAMLGECSLSVGISFVVPGDTYLDIYKKADRALYYVKQNGRNGYEFYHESQQDLLEQGQDGIKELQRFVKLLAKEKTKKGVYEVGYRELNRTLELVARFVERNEQDLQLILFTLEPIRKSTDLEQQQKAMKVLEQAIYRSLRKVDISTRYSSFQHMVVLVDADEAGIEIVAQRIIKGFHSQNQAGEFRILYDHVQLE